jgi:transcription antitermination factor NusG
MIESPKLGWYALYTRHQHEKSVAAGLSGRGFETFLPLYTSMHCWADRTKEVSLALFPCYVFVRGKFGGQELPILTTPGVHSFVRHAGRAAMIPEVEIDGVRRMIESSLRVEPHPFLQVGDWVRVKSGPLAGQEGILLSKKKSWRLVVSVELLGRSVAVEVDGYSIERVAGRKQAAASVLSVGEPATWPASRKWSQL